jgi:gluconate kinase
VTTVSSGKTTIAEKALALLKSDTTSHDVHCIGLDLDICIPQWMKDNFVRGVYPTLQERMEFAKDCCEYVEIKCLEEQSKISTQRLAALISFSFVNKDLRDVFRTKFPSAVWVLVDTSEEVANIRIRERQGHFYGGEPEDQETDSKKDPSKGIETDEDHNSRWKFAPVDFPHVVLDGNRPIDPNAKEVSEIVRKISVSMSTTKE